MSLTGLTSLHFCACTKPGSIGKCHSFFFMLNDLRREVVVLWNCWPSLCKLSF